ncbi:MAG: sporulation protein YqfD [Clostridiales bacterium]|nr:sporulation protein YqfD [Clostridiales bacterium]
MFFIKLIRFFMGYITFTASGGFSERFINLCSQNRVILWDIKNIDGKIYANTSIKGYKKIRESAKRSSMKVRIYEKHGLPFFMNKHRGRAGFLVGLVFFLMIISLLSTRIWTINVVGNEKVTDKQVLEVFKDLGVYSGARISKINVEDVQELAKSELGDLSWLALNIRGSAATIEVREQIKKPKVEKQNPCNIVASYGGQIVKLEVYEGQVNQELGSAVAKGDLIISGVIENLDGSSELRRANGLVIAKTDRVLTQEQSKTIRRKVPIREKKRYRLIFFGLDFPLFWLSNNNENAVYYKHEHRLVLADSILPIGFAKEGYKIYDEYDINLQDDVCELIAFSDFTKQQKEKLGSIEILDEKIRIEKNEDKCNIKGVYVCKESISQKQEIFVEN